ncbi:serine/threonine-protein kinase [Streptomyces sp. NBC_00989]|uniref:serine/threonine-protein kinase n=1 Tax=Streptomyces sp. NBC_00989 TaxID=2903705 RepID=UPI003863E355|nr:serine/threonine protein kinase [Streptomyces sp. NBC_00989]
MDGVDRLLAGRYRVVAQLGRGGMGVVWRAVDEVLGREVAVKELRTFTDAHGPELADLRLRMQREARAAARVRHPGVVAVHDIAEVDGRPLIVMELIDGPSLDDVLGERGPIDPREAAGIGAKVMEALAAAHSVGVLHRDVKPGNILLDHSGRVVLTDFGIATMDDPGDGSATHLTRSGELIGSLDYLAPERAQGADPGPASDVWALGATLYAAVEGASPFRRTSTYSTLTAIVSEPLPESRRAGRLGPVLRQLMEKQAELRPGADVARELLEGVAGAPGVDLPTAVLRGAGGGVPAVPPGFGAVESRGSGSAGAGAGVPEPTGSKESTEARAAGLGAAGAALADTDLGAGTGAGVRGAGAAEPTESGQGLGAVRHAAPAGQGFGTGEPAGGSSGPGSGGSPEDAGPEGAGVDASGWSGSGGSTPGSPGRLGAAAYGVGAAGLPGAGVQGPDSSERPAADASAATPLPTPTLTPTPTFVPHGFGPPLAPVSPVAPAPHPSPPTGPMTHPPAAPRRKARILIAAAAVVAVLAGAGVVVARMVNSADTKVTSQPSASSPAGAGVGPASPSGRTDADRSIEAEPTGQGGDGTQAPTQRHTGKGENTAAGQDPTVAPSKSMSSGGGSTGGGAPATGGATPSSSPASVCQSIGGGKYNCQVWRSAKSYTASGTEAGVLGAGTNYFFCQQHLGRRETYGQWTNVWWAKTDDDSGNTDVYVSDVYLKGGGNDEPIPGLPVC